VSERVLTEQAVKVLVERIHEGIGVFSSGASAQLAMGEAFLALAALWEAHEEAETRLADSYWCKRP
jgi:hypothetical protein